MLRKVKKTILDFDLLNKGEKVVVGVSGGPDSVALLHILLRLRESFDLTVYVAHLNHQIRGDNADEDARFVANLAKKWNVECRIKSVDVPALSRRRGLSTEDAGRVARYEFFEEMAQETGSNRIAVAHHSDDQAETVLINLIRGAGVEGLAGMKPIRDQKIIRPLLYVSREEIENYCQKQGLDSRQDESNLETDYQRNKIRLLLIPCIENNFNPQFRKALSRTAEILKDESDLLQSITEQKLDEHLKLAERSCCISRAVIKFESLAIQRRMIRTMISRLCRTTRGISFDHIEQIIEMIKNEKTGKQIHLPGKITADIDYEDLCIREAREKKKVEKRTRILQIPGLTETPEFGYSFEVCYTEDNMNIEKNNRFCIVLDPEKISLPIYVRNRNSGDKILLPGGIGTSKIKKIFIDKKINRECRDEIPIIVDARDRILWVVGIKTSDFCLQDKAGKGAIKIEAKEV